MWKETLDKRTGINSHFTKLSVLIFLFFCGLLLVHHEMWRDELQAWLIAKDSSSILNLFHNLKHEGHPYLWYIGLYLISRFTEQPFAMQLLHLIIATGVIYIFVKFSPFTKLQKMLFIFGYFPLYEYGVISRNYSLGFLLVFAFCAVFQTSGNRKLVVLSGILFLLSQANAYALIIAVTLGLTLVFEALLDAEVRERLFKKKWILLVSISIFAFGIIISILQQLLPPDSSSNAAGGWHLAVNFKEMGKALTIIWKAYVPIPRPRLHFWGSNIITKPILQLVLSSILLCYFLLLFVRKPVILFLYSIGTIGIVAVTYMKFYGYIRQHGHLFILLITCLWLSAYYPDKKIRLQFINNLSNFCSKYKNRVIIFILATQLIAGVFAGAVDLVYPFSGGKAVAKFIEDKQMQDMLLIGDDESAITVASYLNKKIYYIRGGRLGSFVIWDKKRVAVWAKKQKLNSQELLTIAEDQIARYKKDALLILNYQPAISNSKPHKSRYSLVMIKKFTGNIEPGEQFYLYILKPDTQSGFIGNPEIFRD
jgi:hypothetical protein